MIDLRSDTITLPSAEMRKVMAQAPVGDDVFSDDPTVNALEQRTAEILGKEAAVFMPSGTMTNQVAVRTHTQPGDEILLDENAHIYFYEGGGTAALSGAICRLIPGTRGIFGAVEMEAAMRPVDVHYPQSKIVCVENTTNRGGGKVWPLEKLAEVQNSARENNLIMHLDGARIWNAAAALNVTEAEIAKFFDSVSVCFSKGLGAPVGSALVGSQDFILEARRFRKQYGGGMRQAGIIAAGALYALDNHRSRLAEDHANAKAFAQGLAEIPGIEINPGDVETNIIMFGLSKMTSAELIKRLGELDTHMLAMDSRSIRAVTNLMVTEKQISEALEQIRSILS
ncbi:MAG: aminotransferase class I/II-fold pyridoxal phosphate-dependent enzyme [SAR324 cluster bacterium]|nr:aminotransferase class I/II-fold pyridoxal phosphate-dependent enzyme [SAR324 cluster bacterium]MBL7034544.1 aminotransferase class I/II-fold pyridoxal phosphate-dependent enzyme [SAR324 cluster bacterium]